MTSMPARVQSSAQILCVTSGAGGEDDLDSEGHGDELVDVFFFLSK